MHIERDTEETETIKPLNMRQQKFVDNYVTSGNATRAAEAAGYAHPNVQAFRLLENISVKAAIEAIRSDMADDTEQRRGTWIKALEQLGMAISMTYTEQIASSQDAIPQKAHI